MSDRLRRQLLVLLLVGGVLPSIACGTVVIPTTLALESPSEITIAIPIFPPPYDQETTSLVGGVETTITTELGLLELLGITIGIALPADISVDDILIAGTEIVIGGLLPTGTLCVALDPDLPGGGSALINPLLGVAEFNIALNTLIHITDPGLGGVLGGALPFGAAINAVTPLSLGDLLDLMAGGTGGLSLTQEIDTTLPPDTPVIGPSQVTATLTLATTETFPSDPLLDECEAYLAGL